MTSALYIFLPTKEFALAKSYTENAIEKQTWLALCLSLQIHAEIQLLLQTTMW